MGVKRGLDSNENLNERITEDEAALYDRQIRLWGLDCQKRLREARILIIGLNGLGVEVVKNLTLSGVKSVTIMDETPVSELDYSAQYFVVGSAPGNTRAEASKSAIQELNPNVTIVIDKDPLESKDAKFFAEFSVVFATGIPLKSLTKVNEICHKEDVLFFCGETWGFYGYGFLDLLSHNYSKKLKRDDTEATVFGKFDYCTLDSTLTLKFGSGLGKRTSKIFVLFHLINHFFDVNQRFPSPLSREEDLNLLREYRDECVRNLNCDADKIPDSLLSCVFGELAPICAAVGGILANEIIKGISKQGEPLCNFLFFDGDECTGAVERIMPKP
ncbi:SUMO-activating enzyme subunit 1 [Parasteatoda tepidariorum]|uniref:SUMO-activating enzyme subunit 1 n=1 Tax=Parasteatoda tepidariorum TaxID=114398 RepID=UPI00077FA65C|nr:SUMO-activating enzyme subunit 1 [Parasteatoda tepidariorum]